MRLPLELACALVVLALAVPAVADHDTFYGTLTPEPPPGGTMTGGGTGWNGGEWIYYPSGWWNQWFYNDPPYIDNWKEVWWDIILEPAGGTGGAQRGGVALRLQWEDVQDYFKG